MISENKFLDKLYTVCQWVTKVYVSNLLWILFSIPVFITIYALAIQLNSNADIFMATFWPCITLIIVISPITLFPSTAALISIVRKWILKKEINSLFMDFVEGYKNNFKNSFKGGVVFAIVSFLLLTSIWLYGQLGTFMSIILYYLCIILLVLTCISSMFYISMIVHTESKWTIALKTSLIISIIYPLETIIMTVVTTSAIMLCMKYTFLAPLIIGTFVTWYGFWRFERLYEKMLKI